MSKEKDEIYPVTTNSHSIRPGEVSYAKPDSDEFEVFTTDPSAIQFRLVGWIRASVIFLKIIFATGVLSIPTAMFGLGAVGGAMCVLGFGALNTYFAIVQGNFRNRHAQCHSIADMAQVVGGPILKEICGALFIAAYVLCSGSGIVGLSVAFNALTNHAACTVWWAFVSFVLIVSCASVRKFELGYHAIAYPSFMVGITSVCTIFISSAGTSAFLPVISEMRNPRDYNKSVYLCMAIVQSSYLAFSLVVYRWCGKWVTDPSLGSAGGTLKKVAYGVGLIGLMVSGCLYLHVAAKYCFVRILRHSRHLQQNTFVHWGTWLGCTIGLGSLAFVLAEAIPIFSFLIALTGSVCFAPLAIILPAWLWIHDHSEYKSGGAVKMVVYWTHWFLILVGIFICVGGTYGVIANIVAAYDSGLIGGAFSCADNSGTIH